MPEGLDIISNVKSGIHVYEGKCIHYLLLNCTIYLIYFKPLPEVLSFSCCRLCIQASLSFTTSVTTLIASGGQAVSSLHDLRLTSVLTDKQSKHWHSYSSAQLSHLIHKINGKSQQPSYLREEMLQTRSVCSSVCPCNIVLLSTKVQYVFLSKTTSKDIPDAIIRLTVWTGQTL